MLSPSVNLRQALTTQPLPGSKAQLLHTKVQVHVLCSVHTRPAVHTEDGRLSRWLRVPTATDNRHLFVPNKAKRHRPPVMHKPSGAKLNGTSANGSSSNQEGQAAAPKAPGEAPPKAKRPAKAKNFDNTNRFIVPQDKTEEFEATWREREANMQQLPGFLGFSLDKQQGSDYVVISKWASIPEWEVYSLSETARRTHLPWGVYQYVPAKGEGFPEDFIPFKQMDAMVNAKY